MDAAGFVRTWRAVSGWKTAALLTPLVLASASCGSEQKDRAPAKQLAVTSRAVIAGQPPARGLQTWAAPILSGGSREYVASLRHVGSAGPDAPRVRVRLTGVGRPATGTGAGARYVGPGVTAPWTRIAHGRYVVSIRHQGERLGLRIWSRGGQWRAKVDGKYVDRTPRSVGSDYALHTVGLDFSHGQPGERRVVEFELRGGAWLAGVVAGAGDTLSLPRPPRGATVYWLGDSYFAGGGARHPGFSDLVESASARLRFNDVIVDALGGTGYAQDNAAARFADYVTRAKANLGKGKVAPDIIVVGGSINDVSQPPGVVERAARRLYSYIARAVPSAKVVVVPFSPRFPVPANFAERIRGVLQAAAGRPNLYVFNLPASVGSTTGLQGSDGHPTQRGHDEYGRLIAEFIMKRCPGLPARCESGPRSR
jgi:lysophospholipase L1-like esterase